MKKHQHIIDRMVELVLNSIESDEDPVQYFHDLMKEEIKNFEAEIRNDQKKKDCAVLKENFPLITTDFIEKIIMEADQ